MKRSVAEVTVLFRFRELSVQKTDPSGTSRDSYYIDVDVGGTDHPDYLATFDADSSQRWRYSFMRTWDAGDDDGDARVRGCMGLRPVIDLDRDVVVFSFPGRCVNMCCACELRP